MNYTEFMDLHTSGITGGRQRLIVSRETLITFELRLGSYA
jgi:hypothetical protein